MDDRPGLPTQSPAGSAQDALPSVSPTADVQQRARFLSLLHQRVSRVQMKFEVNQCFKQ